MSTERQIGLPGAPSSPPLETVQVSGHENLVSTASRGRKNFSVANEKPPGDETRIDRKSSYKRTAGGQAVVPTGQNEGPVIQPIRTQRKRATKAVTTSKTERQATIRDMPVDAENSIEPSQVRSVATDQQQVPHGPLQPPAVLIQPLEHRTGDGNRFLFNLRGIAQPVGAWLLKRGRGSMPPSMTTTASYEKPLSSDGAVPARASIRDSSTAIPESVARRFLKIEQEYYFADKTLAFTDRGNKLATRGAHPDVVRSLIDIAVARGWGNITVRGTEEFRRSAWFAAAQSGLRVAGFEPTALDLAELANRPANNAVEKGAVRQKEPSFKHESPGSGKDFFVPDLAPQTESMEAPGRKSMTPDIELTKKAKAFQENKPAFVVKKYPELAGAYGIVEAAHSFATEKLPKSSRDEFVRMARCYVLQKIIIGEEVKGPKVYLAQPKAKEANEQTKIESRGAVDLGHVAGKDAVKEQ
jgi:hypothetical protein